MLQTNRRSPRSNFWRAPLPKLPWQRNALVVGSGLVGFMGLAGVKSATEWPKSRWAAAEKKRARLHETDYTAHKVKALESNCEYRKALVEGSVIRGLVLTAGVSLFVIVTFSPRTAIKMCARMSPRTNYVGKRLTMAGGFVGVGYLTHNDFRLHYSDYCNVKHKLWTLKSTSKSTIPKTHKTSAVAFTSAVQLPPPS